MATSGKVTATYMGIGKNGEDEAYSKTWEMQPVTGVDVPAEIVTLMANGVWLTDAYASVTKGAIVGASLSIDLTGLGNLAMEQWPYKNRAAAVSGTIDGNPAKKFTAYIQAARAGIFVGNTDADTIVDVVDGALVDYFAALNNGALLSDGEIPHEDPVSGYRIDRKFSSKD